MVLVEGSPSSTSPSMKKRKLNGCPLATSARTLERIKKGDEQHADSVMQALNNAVVEAGSSMIGGKENEDALQVLTELLAQEVIDPNVGDEKLWSRYGGSPLHQACSLDLPEATKALLEHGASVVQVFNKKTPLEVALEKKGSRCVKVIMEHIEKLEKQARSSRRKGSSRCHN